jgi:hypothetical protein
VLCLLGVSHAQDLGAAITAIDTATTQTKSIATAIVVLLSSLLAIGLVVMLYIKVSNK